MIVFLFTRFYTKNASWHGNNSLIFHICKEDRPNIYMEDEPKRAYPRTTIYPFILVYFTSEIA
jgi:hypothetical protein